MIALSHIIVEEKLFFELQIVLSLINLWQRRSLIIASGILILSTSFTFFWNLEEIILWRLLNFLKEIFHNHFLINLILWLDANS